MYHEGKEYLPKGSVRSLPKGKLQEYRQLFGKTSQDSVEESDRDSHVGSRFESIPESMADIGKSPHRWRPPLPEHKRREGSPSPVNTSKSHPPQYKNFPMPSPRKSVTGETKADAVVSNQGLAKLPFAKFGEIASGIAMAESSPSQVNKVRERFETNSEQSDSPSGKLDVDGNAKVPLKPRNVSPRKKSPSPSRPMSQSPKKSPLLLRRPHEDIRHTNDNHHYSAIWKDSSPARDQGSDRPISVLERTKIFSGNSSQPKNNGTPVQLTKPAKPPPPIRQKSQTDEQPNTRQSAAVKNTPPRPPFRQRSVSDKSRPGMTDDQTDTIATNENSAKKGPLPPPPSKPRRTGAHDDYLKVKLDNAASANRVAFDEVSAENQNQTALDNKPIGGFEKHCHSWKKGQRPHRPPPPKKKPRPFSIATDSFNDFLVSSGEHSDFEDCSMFKQSSVEENSFYETVPADLQFPTKKPDDSIQHWDLPRISHPEPTTMRRSLSAECVQKAVDDDGNVVYMDPDILHLDDKSKPGYEIYVDTEGYAVPNRLIKRDTPDVSSSTESSRPMADRMKSKIRRGFKNLFMDQDKTSSDRKQPGIDRASQKRKLDGIRQKVNQAFEVLQGSIKLKPEVEDDPLADRRSNDSDSRVDEKEIKKRVEYSRSVRDKTRVRRTKQEQQVIYPQLFEHAMIVSLQQNSDTYVYEPFVKYKFPEIRNYKLTMEGKLYPCSESKDTNVSVPLFCFPDAANFKPSSSSSKSQSYNFVLTNFDGGRVYGYCRRLLPRKSPMKIPEVICIISPVDAFNMYNELLMEIERKRQESLDAAQELIAAAFGRPLPAPGQAETIRTLDENGDMETVYLNREADNRIDNANVECLLTYLGSDKLLKVFATILLERSVLFCAKQLSTLSSVIHAIVSLLYPFSWQHTFIPVLPSDMLDVVCSPIPYIIGITSSLLPKALETSIEDNVLVVDIDKRTLVRNQGDESTLLPKKIEKALKTSLNMCRVDSDAKSFPNAMISEAFLKFFVEAIGHYGQYILTQPDGVKTFEKEEFVKGGSSSTMRQLLEWLVETQMFEVFMTRQLERKDWNVTIDLFQSRIHEKFTGKNLRRQLGKKFSS